MAQALVKSNADSRPAGATTADFVKSTLVAMLLGVGGGAAFGYFALPTGMGQTAVEEMNPSAPATQPPTSGRFPADALEIPIPSIIVDLSGEPKSRARLDISVIAVHGTSESSLLKNEIREDVIAYVKGLTVSDIQGVRGFQNLREQLEDRARIRGRGSVLGLLIGGFVVE